MDSGKFQSVKVNIAFHKTLSDAPKVAVKDESLNKCSEFYGQQQVFLSSTFAIIRHGTHHCAPYLVPGTYESKSNNVIPALTAAMAIGTAPLLSYGVAKRA